MKKQRRIRDANEQMMLMMWNSAEKGLGRMKLYFVDGWRFWRI